MRKRTADTLVLASDGLRHKIAKLNRVGRIIFTALHKYSVEMNKIKNLCSNYLYLCKAHLIHFNGERFFWSLRIINFLFQNPAFELSEIEILHKLGLSATNQTTIEFDYFSPHTQKSSHRKVDVYLLHNFGGDWYAISFDHNREEMRDFHAGRITNLKETNESFEIRKNIWNKENYLRTGFQMTRGGRLTTVEILFDVYQAQWIRKRKFFHPDERKEELADGSLRLSFQIGQNALEAVARFCLQYSGNCIAEKPARLREIIKEKLFKAMEVHQ